jgi:hypothetical protein
MYSRRRTAGFRNKNGRLVLFDMTDLIEDVLAPTVIERAMGVFESLRERDHSEIVQARKALTPHLFGLIASGQTDQERLLVSALIFLKSLETRAKTGKP